MLLIFGLKYLITKQIPMDKISFAKSYYWHKTVTLSECISCYKIMLK